MVRVETGLDRGFALKVLLFDSLPNNLQRRLSQNARPHRAVAICVAGVPIHW